MFLRGYRNVIKIYIAKNSISDTYFTKHYSQKQIKGFNFRDFFFFSQKNGYIGLKSASEQ